MVEAKNKEIQELWLVNIRYHVSEDACKNPFIK
jgi:hypothetical protein